MACNRKKYQVNNDINLGMIDNVRLQHVLNLMAGQPQSLCVFSNACMSFISTYVHHTCQETLRDDKVSMLTSTFLHNPPEED